MDCRDRRSGPGCGHARRGNKIGLTESAFPLATFATTKGKIGSRFAITGGDTAIIGGEYDYRVLQESISLQSGEGEPYPVVHGLNHASVNRVVLHLANRTGAINQETFLNRGMRLRLLLILCPKFFGALNRPVNLIK